MSQYSSMDKFKNKLIRSESDYARIFKQRVDGGFEESENSFERFLPLFKSRFGTRSQATGKVLDANYGLQLYETSINFDERIVRQLVETSMLRATFDNYPNERIFYETTRIKPTDVSYIIRGVGVTGTTANTPTSSLTPEDSRMGVVNASMRYIQARADSIDRMVEKFKIGFAVSVDELDIAVSQQIPLIDILTNSCGMELAKEEQNYAFHYRYAGGYTLPYRNGLFEHTLIPSIPWQGPKLLDPAAKPSDIQNEFVRIQALIRGVYKGILREKDFSFISSIDNIGTFRKAYSDLLGQPLWQILTDNLQLRLAGLPIFTDKTVGYMYINDPMNIELATAGAPLPYPTDYDGATTSYRYGYQLNSAGLVVKRPEFIYKITGLNNPAE